MKQLSILTILVVVLICSSVWSVAADVQIHGFISQGYLRSSENNFYKDTKDGTFEFNELGINFATKPTSRVMLGVQLFSYDLGDIGNDEVVVDWAFADCRFKEWANLRAGKMKAPMGLYNESRDVDLLRTSVFLPQSVYFEILRDSMLAITGIGVYGDVDLGLAGSLSYLTQGGGMNIKNDGGTAQGIIALGVDSVDKIEVKSAYAGGLKWSTPIPGLLLAFSQTNVDLEVFSDPLVLRYNDFDAFVYSIEFTWNDLIIAAELNRMFIDTFLNNSPYGFLKLGGFYGSVAYRFIDWFEAAVIYSEWYDDWDNKHGRNNPGKEFGAWQKDWTLALRFDINSNWLAKLEYHYIDGTNQILAQYGRDGNSDEQYWSMYAIKLTYSF
jgi:hypothetical protein